MPLRQANTQLCIWTTAAPDNVFKRQLFNFYEREGVCNTTGCQCRSACWSQLDIEPDEYNHVFFWLDPGLPADFNWNIFWKDPIGWLLYRVNLPKDKFTISCSLPVLYTTDGGKITIQDGQNSWEAGWYVLTKLWGVTLAKDGVTNYVAAYEEAMAWSSTLVIKNEFGHLIYVPQVVPEKPAYIK
jgi:hypothetical protein